MEKVTYIFLKKGNWEASHIWDRRLSTKEYEKEGFEIKIIDFNK